MKILSDDTVKTVNMFASSPVNCGFAVPFVGRILNKKMKVKDIYRCIQARAKVEEVLPNGKIVKLGYNNYNTDNFNVNQPKKEIIPTLTPIPIVNGIPTPSLVNKKETVKINTPVVETNSPLNPKVEEVKEESKQEDPIKETTVIDDEEEEIRRMIEEEEAKQDNE